MVTLSSTKEARIHNGKKANSSSGAGKTGQTLVKPTSNTIHTQKKKKNSKWVKDIDVRIETVKLLEENIGKTLSDINHSRIL